MKTTAKAVACDSAGRVAANGSNGNASSPKGTAGGRPGGVVENPRAAGAEGFLLSGVDASAVLGGPTCPEGGVDAMGRQDRLADQMAPSVVPYGRLVQMARAAVRRMVRLEFDFDWAGFREAGVEWRLTDLVHRKAVREAAESGSVVKATDVPTDVVYRAVERVLGQMDEAQDERPTWEGFCEAQRLRARVGQMKRAEGNAPRNREILLLRSGGMQYAEIGCKFNLSASQVGKIVRRARERAAGEVVLLEPVEVPVDEPWEFPAPDVPRQERWPAMQVHQQTGLRLGIEDTVWLCGVGACYKAEGRVDDLMYAIRKSAGAQDPWAYLVKSIENRGDAWQVSAQLLGDVLAWAGMASLEYSLQRIGSGDVGRPLPYLGEVLRDAVAGGREGAPGVDRPVAAAVALASELCPQLQVFGADQAIAVEGARNATRFLDSYVRRYGRTPWDELETSAEAAENRGLESSVSLGVCGGDDSSSEINLEIPSKSSFGDHKADAAFSAERGLAKSAAGEGVTSSRPVAAEKLEHGAGGGDSGGCEENRRPESQGEALNAGRTTWRPSPREKREAILEHGPCRHPLASLMVSAMDLEAVVLVECSEGCGHWLYSDRGPVRCPCHWPAAVVTQMFAALSSRGGGVEVAVSPKEKDEPRGMS